MERHAITQHCVLAGFVASHLLIHFYKVSVGIFQQRLGDFSKCEGVSDLSVSVLLLPWKCPLMGKVHRLLHQALPVSLFPQWNRPLLWSLPAASYYKT